MHEMSIVEGLLEAIQSELQPRPGARVRSVRVQVGRLRQVEPATLEFCFRAATQGTPLEGARLEIEQMPARARCVRCEREFAVADDWFLCPQCESAGARLLSGHELTIESIELSDA